MAPLYDTVPTVLWPELRADAAMRINGREPLAGLTTLDLVAEAERWHLNVRDARRVVVETLEGLRGVLSSDAISPDSAVWHYATTRIEQLLDAS